MNWNTPEFKAFQAAFIAKNWERTADAARQLEIVDKATEEAAKAYQIAKAIPTETFIKWFDV